MLSIQIPTVNLIQSIFTLLNRGQWTKGYLVPMSEAIVSWTGDLVADAKVLEKQLEAFQDDEP